MSINLKRASWIGVLCLIMAGCSQGKQAEPAQDHSVDKMKDPVTLTFYQFSGSISDEEFQKLVAEPVSREYPNVKMELLRSGKGTTPEELVASGNLPDIIYTGSAGAATIADLNIAMDLNPLVAQNKVDLGKFNPLAVDSIKTYSKKGEFLAFPFAINFSTLYYNKDIFDKFGVSYPKDGMSWDDAIAVAKKVTREENGVSYLGLEFDSGNGGIRRLGEQLELKVTAPGTFKATLNTDGWKMAMDTMKAIKSIPGNINPNPPIPAFEKDKNVAMMAGYGARLGELEELYNQGNPVNYDLATMPYFAAKPKNAWGINLFMLMLSSTGKHHEQAFEVVKLLTEPDVQTSLNKRGRLTSLKENQNEKTFGENIVSLKGKNKQAIFKTNIAPLPAPTVYDNIVYTQLNKASDNVVKDGMDPYTALREAEAEANQLVEAALKK